MHQRSPASSFIGRKQVSWSRADSALRNSDAPPHIKYGPPQARKQQLGRPLGTQGLNSQHSSHIAPHVEHGSSKQSSGSSLPAADQAPTGPKPNDPVARDAFPMSFGSRKQPGRAQSSWQARADLKDAVLKDPTPAQRFTEALSGSVRPSAAAEAETDQSGPAGMQQVTSGQVGAANEAVHQQQGPGASEAFLQQDAKPDAEPGLMPAAKPGDGGSRPTSAGKSARKAGMMSRMIKEAASSVTNFFHHKAVEQPSQADTLQNLAILYPSDDCSDS